MRSPSTNQSRAVPGYCELIDDEKRQDDGRRTTIDDQGAGPGLVSLGRGPTGSIGPGHRGWLFDPLSAVAGGGRCYTSRLNC